MGRLTSIRALVLPPIPSLALALGLALVLVALAPSHGAAAPLIENGALLEGSGTQPVGWQPDAWNRDATRFGWQAEDERGTLALTNLVANDAHWCQTVAVMPGSTYRISAEVKTQDVGTATAGAFISIEPRVGHSRFLDGTNDWQRLVLTIEAIGPARQWDVCLRLGSNASLNTGTAWFRNIAMLLVRAGDPERHDPSLSTRTAQWVRQTGWAGTLLPLAAGLVLAFGLGLFDRRSPPDR